MTLSKTHTKYIQSLQHKKFRDEFDAFIAEGPKVVLELLDSRAFTCTALYTTEAWLKKNAGLPARYGVTNVVAVQDFELEKISALSTPNTMLAVFKKRQPAMPQSSKGKITLVLDTIQDPGNLGTIIRTADWFGVADIICTPDCADQYNSKVVQSTMGSLARVNMLYTDIVQWLNKNSHIPIYATAMDGRNIKELRNVSEAIIIIGNEGKGISEAVMQLAKEKITIPKKGDAESLNAAVATGIVLSHLA